MICKMKKLLVFLVSVLTMALLLTGCGGDTEKKDAAAGGEQQVLNLFSWADNFDPEVIAEFEKQYNCKVNYDVFANNEELLAKIQAGGAQYDVIQPSDYMVATMLKLDLLEKMNMDNIPNAKNIVSTLKAPVYDPTGDHSLVYTWGITGIAYNKNYVKDVPDSWEDLWKYKKFTGARNSGRPFAVNGSSLGISKQIVFGWTANLFSYPCGFKSGKYIQYSSAFGTFG